MRENKTMKINKKHGRSPIQRNWNKLAELTQKGIYMTKKDELEIKYRIAVQNEFASKGKIPSDFIEPK